MAGAKSCQMFLSHITLNVHNIETTSDYYTKLWGMKLLSAVQNKASKETHTILGYEGETGDTQSRLCTCLELVSMTSALETEAEISRELVNHTSDDDVYWKHGFNAPDVAVAVTQLQKAGVDVKAAVQLKQSGFFTHLYDPQGFKIELLQFTFEGSLCAYDVIPDHPLRQRPVLAMLSLRVSDITASLKFYVDALGMRLLCRVDESDTHGFKLYFLAFTAERPPSPDIDAVTNREWLFQRTYAVLELLVYDEPKPNLTFRPLQQGQAGFAGFGLSVNRIDELSKRLDESDVPYERGVPTPITSLPALTLQDPDNIPIRITQI